MSRYREWNRALSGISNYMSGKVKLNDRDFKVEIAAINKFCKKEGIEGSLTTKILATSKRFADFKKTIVPNREKEVKS